MMGHTYDANPMQMHHAYMQATALRDFLRTSPKNYISDTLTAYRKRLDEQDSPESLRYDDSVYEGGRAWMQEYMRNFGNERPNNEFLRDALAQGPDPRLTDVWAHKTNMQKQAQHMMQMMAAVENQVDLGTHTVNEKVRLLAEAEAEDSDYRQFIDRLGQEYGTGLHENYKAMREEFDDFLDNFTLDKDAEDAMYQLEFDNEEEGE